MFWCWGGVVLAEKIKKILAEAARKKFFDCERQKTSKEGGCELCELGGRII